MIASCVHFPDTVLEYENYDLSSIVTPVDVVEFNRLLKQAGYNDQKRLFLFRGFSSGFSLKYYGPRKVQHYTPNLKLRVGSPRELWNKVMTEMKAKCYAGPYREIPFTYFIQSPIGLVPKDKGTKTRLIFHLSYPKDGDSVNSGIPKKFCKVKYPNFAEAIQVCIDAGKSCSVAKSDMAMAFRHVPLSSAFWQFLILKCHHPVSGKLYYFVEKCLSFGSSISCAIFQAVSDGIAFIVRFRIANRALLNYLDNYFFAQLYKKVCDYQVRMFLDTCKQICFLVLLEKTFWRTTILVFLGLLIDTEEQVVRIPHEKVSKALDLIQYFLNRANRSITVLQVQRLCGTLNFITRCIIPGRVFLTRLYSMIDKPQLKQHHHVHITAENRLDLEMWHTFLTNQAAFKRPFLDLCNKVTSVELDMYSDASGSKTKGGFGAYCGKKWVAGSWDATFILNENPSIEYLELFALTAGVLLWIKDFKNTAVCIFTDNESVKYMINDTSASCKNCMVLLHLIVLECMVQNVKLTAEHVRTDENGKADALSRGQMKRFRELGPDMNEKPKRIPELIWPITKIWLK